MTAISENNIIECEPNGKVKKSKFYVGDFVELEENKYGSKYIVTSVLDRINNLVRPPIANLDQLFILISKVPKTDYLLIDKLIIYCAVNNIVPFLVINKKDLYTEQELESIRQEYAGVVADIIIVSAKEKIGIEYLKECLKGKVSAFSGQSAVGKSTLINAIDSDLKLSTNGLSKKISRGKHTTRHSEIFVINDDILIADTPGFSMLDLQLDIDYKELSRYYSDFAMYLECKYSNCDHTNLKDKDCCVARAVLDNKININRYNRYVELYKIMKEKWRKKYD